MIRLVGESKDEGEHGADDENSDGGDAEEGEGDGEIEGGDEDVDTSKLSCNFLLLTLLLLWTDLISLVAM